jgi:hypothetical protein
MTYEEAHRLRKVEAILCGVLRVLSITEGEALDLFSKVDWKEAGLSHQEAVNWWMEHVAKDKRRDR